MAGRKPSLFEKMQTSLQHRVIGLVSFVMLSAALSVVVVFIYFVYQTEQSAWQSRQHDAADNAARTVETFMKQVQEYLNLVSIVDRDYLEANPEFMARLLAQNQALAEIIRLDKEGRVFASANRSDDTPVLSNLFTILQSGWFLQARAGKPYVGDMQISAANQPYLILALPAPDGGVVAARLRMDVLWEVVAKIQFGATGRAYVVDPQGNLIAHPEADVVLARANIKKRPELIAALNTPDHTWTGIYPNFKGLLVQGFTLPIKTGDWIIFTEVSWAEAFSTTHQAVLALGGGILLLSLLVVVGTSRWLNHLILRPMTQLRDGVEHIGQGDWGYRLDSQRRDEIGQVAAAFNQMAARLKEREEALAQARDEALAANRLKSQLLANVSHDLRTPLNAILGHTEMLQKGVYGPLSDKQHQITGRVLTNTHNLTGMVGKLIEQARLETGTLKLEMAPFVLADLIEEVKSTMSLAAEQKGVQLTTGVAADVPPVLAGDFNWLYQILANLVENALKFTEQGSVEVYVYRPDETHWAMQVADTGPGIPAEAQAYIFEPFRQVDGTATRKHKGAGLGLSIVKQVTTRMGGQVILESSAGQGSTFTILLPLTQEETAL